MKRRTFIRDLAASAALLAPGAARGAAEGGELGKHKIAAIETRKVAQPWPRLVGKNARLDVHGRGPRPEIAILKTDQGASGWGMIRGDAQAARKLEAALVGKSVAEAFDPATGTRPAFKALDIPLHDLAGVILGQPVWKLIGGGKEPVTPKIYSGMIYFDDLEPADKPRGIDILLEECRRDRDYGYRQVKIKIGRGAKWMEAAAGLRRDIEAVRAIAKAFPDCEILVDANNGYDVATAIRFLEGIEGIPLFWFEEPFHEKPDDWRKLHAWMKEHGFGKTYRADGEYAPDRAALDLLGREGVVNLRLEDILDLGFTKWRVFLPDLAKRGIAASPHAWGAGLKTVYTGHLAAGLGNTPTIEGVTCGEEEVSLGDNRIVDGRFRASSAPGFGLKLV